MQAGFFFAAGTLAAGPALAEAGEGAQCLAAPEALPHDLALTDHTGTAQSFETLVGENGMVLFFIRSVDWCPFCKTQVSDFGKQLDAFEERGLSVVGLSYDPVDEQAAFVDAEGLELTLVSDPDSAVIDAFGLRNGKYQNPAHFAYGVPHPAIYVIGTDGQTRAVLREEGYRNRPPVPLVLDAADRCLAGQAS